MSFVGTSGNASTKALGVGGEYIVRAAPWEFKGKVAYLRNESEGDLKAESFAALFRSTRTLTERLSLFGQYAYLHDLFAGVQSRNVVDGGVTYKLWRRKPHQLDVDAGLGYAHENRSVGEDLSTAQALLAAHYKFALSETAEITDDLGFTFSLSDSSDWRTANVAALTAKLTTLLSLKLSNSIRYVNSPVPGFKTTDSITSVALVAKF